MENKLEELSKVFGEAVEDLGKIYTTIKEGIEEVLKPEEEGKEAVFLVDRVAVEGETIYVTEELDEGAIKVGTFLRVLKVGGNKEVFVKGRRLPVYRYQYLTRAGSLIKEEYQFHEEELVHLTERGDNVPLRKVDRVAEDGDYIRLNDTVNFSQLEDGVIYGPVKADGEEIKVKDKTFGYYFNVYTDDHNRNRETVEVFEVIPEQKLKKQEENIITHKDVQSGEEVTLQIVDRAVRIGDYILTNGVIDSVYISDGEVYGPVDLTKGPGNPYLYVKDADAVVYHNAFNRTEETIKVLEVVEEITHLDEIHNLELTLRKVKRESRGGDYIRLNGVNNHSEVLLDNEVYGPVTLEGVVPYVHGRLASGLSAGLRHVYSQFYERDADTVEVFEVVSSKEVVDNTPNKSRKELVEKAKGLLNENRYWYYTNKEKRYTVKPKFRISRNKGTVKCYLIDKYDGYSRGSAVAKCHPDDVFNEDIGKMVALFMALGKDVPEEYLHAVQPTKLELGMVVARFTYDGKHLINTVKVETIEGREKPGEYMLNGDSLFREEDGDCIFDDSGVEYP